MNFSAIFMNISLNYFSPPFEVTQVFGKLPANRCFKGKKTLRFHIGSPEVSQPKKNQQKNDQNLENYHFQVKLC